MNLEEELRLIENAKSNIQSFDIIYNLYFEKIYRFTYRRLVNKELAEDITENVFLSSIENIKRFDTTKGIPFSAWLYKNAHNKIIDYYRRYKITLNLDYINEDSLNHSNEDIELDFKRDYLNMKVNLVLKDMKEIYVKVITLRYFAELEITEIARILDKKESYVSVLLHRALDSFRKKYKKKFKESEIF